MTASARAFIGLTASAGIVAIAYAMTHWTCADPARFICYLAVALLASGLKVSLPGINGSMSVNFLFILLGIVELSYPETLVIGCAAALVQCFWGVKGTVRPVHVLFNVCSMMATAVACSYLVFTHISPLVNGSIPLRLVAAACTYFMTNTLPVGVIIALTENKPFLKIWLECYFWSFPYYLVGAGTAGLVSYINTHMGWQLSLLILPVVYWIYRSYRLYLGRLEAEKRHVEEMASLHLRTIEALALAIEAKDHTTHDHLQRVRVYAVEVGKELGLCDEELEALRAAALLHDIGKLAIPEQILNKPGKLTPEEFEKMKIHPVIGAEILKRVCFPYPVVPIVEAHHEKWDGSGYPHGLKGEEIPIGARILSAVDCFDALASHRQYRPALSLDAAMQYVVALAGKEFDPRVIDVLNRRYLELEEMAKSSPELMPTRLTTDVKVSANVRPAAGFERPASRTEVSDSFLTCIAAARQEAHSLFEMSHDLGNSLSLEETLSVFSGRLRKLVPYDSIAIFVSRNGMLVPQHVGGVNMRLLSSLEIPVGQGLCGWVAANRRPILNGNPAVEPGWMNRGIESSLLNSAVAVPLEGITGVVGVLALYSVEADAFTTDNMRILLAIGSKVALCIENALKYQQAETSATTDYLTGLPNARSLFLHLDQELARCKRNGTSLAVMVCDLDGFKQVNDLYGHLEGNKVLQLFSQLVRATCREYDYVARMGGDEFVIVVPGLTHEAAQQKAVQLNTLAIQAGREVCGDALLGLSVGTAFSMEDGIDAEQLLSQADRRMYSVKQAHHDRELQLAGFRAGAMLRSNKSTIIN